MDLAWACTAYTALTGRTDLSSEHLAAITPVHALTQEYIDEKLALLARALAAGSIHNPRGWLLRALERDWRPETAPPTEASVLLRLRDLGMSDHLARRLVRQYKPAQITQQLAWLPYRNVRDHRRALSRSIRENWPEPKAAREARIQAGRYAIVHELLNSLEAARIRSETPAARAAGASALAEMRARLGLPPHD